MPVSKSEFDSLPPCDFYTPAELLEADQMYTVYEIARLLQGLDPDAEIDQGTEDVLLDWTIPWIMTNADDLVVAEPRSDDEPAHYGLKEEEESDRADADESDGDKTAADESNGDDTDADDDTE
ncbi:hypothetical protein SAMN04515672_1120 [Natronorubrum texcoconense]|uniref:Uncharacterized protein n=1 Tax=Natronorubrum texcoconense TaxID=1095776 RepID=A0A1G8V1A2_9EURY|nr:hypothetical protein SAMN04515672_1120 [Natronorubrum texcoconense]